MTWKQVIPVDPPAPSTTDEIMALADDLGELILIRANISARQNARAALKSSIGALVAERDALRDEIGRIRLAFPVNDRRYQTCRLIAQGKSPDEARAYVDEQVKRQGEKP